MISRLVVKQLWPSALFMLIVVILWCGLYLKPQQIPAALLNKPVPKFSLPNLNPALPAVTQQIFKDHISVVHFWASWCTACKQEQEILTTINLTGEFQLVGINYKDLKNSADLWLNKRGDPYTVNIVDADGQLGMDLGVYGTPTTYIIDRAGMIRYRHVGALTNELWNKEVIPEIHKLIYAT